MCSISSSVLKNPFLIANWKMNGSKEYIKDYCINVKNIEKSVNLVICPPLVYVDIVNESIKDIFAKEENNNIFIGGQCFSPLDKDGSCTGSINSRMLKDVGSSFGIIAHSETRKKLKYTNEDISRMVLSCISSGMIPIVCFGKEDGEEESINSIKDEVEEIFSTVNKSLSNSDKKSNILIAYEPVWSIGSDSATSVEHISSVVSKIESSFKNVCDLNLTLIYGGSVNSENIKDIIGIDRVGGVIVGRASLDAKQVTEMARKMQ